MSDQIFYFLTSRFPSLLPCTTPSSHRCPLPTTGPPSNSLLAPVPVLLPISLSRHLRLRPTLSAFTSRTLSIGAVLTPSVELTTADFHIDGPCASRRAWVRRNLTMSDSVTDVFAESVLGEELVTHLVGFVVIGKEMGVFF